MSQSATETAAPVIRPAGRADVPAITRIYTPHVLTSLATFEEVPPDEAEMGRRLDDVLARGLPYIVAEVGGEVVGYAYAAPYRARSAYRYSVEDSIYVAADALWRGIGTALLTDLIARCTALGYRQMIAVIGDSANEPSIGLHARAGFMPAGTLRSIGFKFGRWVDSVMMVRPLGDGDRTPPIP
jgi:phosphinothricin acetyltransferase